METLVWMRVPGDVVFSAGCFFLALFAWRLATGGRGNTVIIGSMSPQRR